MNSILTKIQLFLAEANKASVEVSDELIEEFGNACKDAFKKQYTEERKKELAYRMSNIGKPLCQLQMEAQGAERQPFDSTFKMRMILGDAVEAIFKAILKASGVEYQDSEQVKIKIGD